MKYPPEDTTFCLCRHIIMQRKMKTPYKLGYRRQRRTSQWGDIEIFENTSNNKHPGLKCLKYIRSWLYLCTKGYHLSVKVITVIIKSQNTALQRKWFRTIWWTSYLIRFLLVWATMGLTFHSLDTTVATRHSPCPKDARTYKWVTMCQESTALQGWHVIFLLIHDNVTIEHAICFHCTWISIVPFHILI